MNARTEIRRKVPFGRCFEGTKIAVSCDGKCCMDYQSMVFLSHTVEVCWIGFSSCHNLLRFNVQMNSRSPFSKRACLTVMNRKVRAKQACGDAQIGGG